MPGSGRTPLTRERLLRIEFVHCAASGNSCLCTFWRDTAKSAHNWMVRVCASPVPIALKTTSVALRAQALLVKIDGCCSLTAMYRSTRSGSGEEFLVNPSFHQATEAVFCQFLTAVLSDFFSSVLSCGFPCQRQFDGEYVRVAEDDSPSSFSLRSKKPIASR